MKKSHRKKDGKDVFEFRDEDNLESVNRYSELFRKHPNPNSVDDHGSLKCQFLQAYSSGPVAQIKEVPTVTLDDGGDDDDGDDDDGRSSTDDSAASPLDTPHKAGCEVPQGSYSMSDRILEQRHGFTDNSVDEKDLFPGRQLRVSTEPGPLPENGHVSSMIPESPCCDGPVDFGDINGNGNGMVEESVPPTPDSEPEENNDPPIERAHGQSYGPEMDVMDTIVIHTDYVAYGDKYFPASLILISGDTVKMKASALEEECAASSSEWKVEDILRIETQCSNLVNVAKVRIRLLTKDAAHTEIASETSGVGMVEFLVPNWSQQKERMMSLNTRYNAVLSMGINVSCDGDGVLLEDSECSSDPYIPNFEEAFEEVIYPKGEIDAVSVRKSDVDLLKPDVFINDTIIDFYITYLKNGIPPERKHSFHFFSSFFFRKLADLDKNPSSISDGKAAFQRVRRWTRKVNIFEKDYIFIPVNYNLHWSLIVLCHPGEVVNFNDEHIHDALKVPCILHMDSIRGSHSGLKDLLQSYLMEEWKERQKDTSEEISSMFLNIRFVSLELPQQENFSDCGLFLLHYAELFVDDAPVNFSPFRINKFDNYLTRDWFIPAEASLKRVHIQRLIHELLKSRSHECVSPSRNNSFHSLALPVNKEDDNVIQIVSEKSLNGCSLYSESVQDIDISQLDMPLYKPSSCVDSSGLGTTDVLEHCQHYNEGASLAQLGFSITSIREVEGDDHLAHSNLGQSGLHPIDGTGDCLNGASSRDFDQRFQWNMETSDQSNPEDTSSSDSQSCYDLSEETSMRTVDSYEKEHMDQPMEIMDSEEDYASASSDMMETPPEDSQELDVKYGNHDEVGPIFSNLVDEESEDDSGSNENELAVSGVDEKLIVEDSKIIRDVDEECTVEESTEDSGSNENELAVSGADEKLIVEDSKVIRDTNEEWIVEESQEDSGSNENELAVSGVDEKLMVEDSKVIRHVDEECTVKESQEDSGVKENEVAVSGANEKLIVDDSKVIRGVNEECIVEESQEDSGSNENQVAVSGANEKMKVEDSKVIRDVDKHWIVEDSPPDQLRPAKRSRVTPSRGSEVTQVI